MTTSTTKTTTDPVFAIDPSKEMAEDLDNLWMWVRMAFDWMPDGSAFWLHARYTPANAQQSAVRARTKHKGTHRERVDMSDTEERTFWLDRIDDWRIFGSDGKLVDFAQHGRTILTKWWRDWPDTFQIELRDKLKDLASFRRQSADVPPDLPVREDRKPGPDGDRAD